MEINALTLLQEIENRVEKNEPISPTTWVEASLRINALVGDLDNEIARMEALFNKLEVEYLKQDFSSAKAKAYAKADLGYEKYLQLKATRKRIEEFIRLAKKRSSINEL